MDKLFCAKCGALLGKDEYNYLDDLDERVCDSCATCYGKPGLGDDQIAQHYDIAATRQHPH